MSKFKSIHPGLISDNLFRDSLLKDAVLATKKYNLAEPELLELRAVDRPNTQEIEEKASKSFLVIDAFTTDISGIDCANGCGTGGCGTGRP